MWYLSHLLWNVDADEQKLVEEFTIGYYGAAAPHLIAYIDLMSDAGRRAGIPIRCFMQETRGWLPLVDMNHAAKLFDKAAKAVADDPVLTKRVRRERLPLDHAWLKRYDSLQRETRLAGIEFLGFKDPEAALLEFRELLKKYNAGEYRQRRRVPEDFGNDFPLFSQ